MPSRAVAFWRSLYAWQAAAFAWLSLAAVPLAWIDLAVRRLPDALTSAAFVGTMVLLSAAAVANHKPLLIAHVALAAAALAALYLAVALIWPGGMGFGDAKLAGSVGAALVWPIGDTKIGTNDLTMRCGLNRDGLIVRLDQAHRRHRPRPFSLCK